MYAKHLSLILFAGFVFSSVVSLAQADDGDPVSGVTPTPSTTASPTIYEDLRCEFEGGATGKDGAWFERCEVRGRISLTRGDGFEWVGGENGIGLVVRCESEIFNYRDGVLYGLTPNGAAPGAVDTLITGLSTIAPFIRVHNLNYHDLIRDPEKSRTAEVTLRARGFNVQIPGVCEFSRPSNPQ
jgi:hypothetical protein